MSCSRAVVMALAYAFGLGLLCAGVVAIQRMRCESFGCMGIGVAWFAWSVAGFLPVLLLGLRARWRARLGTRVRQLVGWGLIFQLVSGVVLLAWWAWRQL